MFKRKKERNIDVINGVGNYCHGLNVKKFPKIIQINQSEQESFVLLK